MILKNTSNPNLTFRKLRPRRGIITEIKTGPPAEIPSSPRVPRTTKNAIKRNPDLPSISFQAATPRSSIQGINFRRPRLNISNSQTSIQPSLLQRTPSREIIPRSRRLSNRKLSTGRWSLERSQKSASYSNLPRRKNSVKQKRVELQEIVTSKAPQVPELEAGQNQELLQALQFIKNLPEVDNAQLRAKMVTLPSRLGPKNMKTIIFDMDETLVHCCNLTNSEKFDVQIPVYFPTGERVEARMNIRPYTKECLQAAVNMKFEVIVFTASLQCYADAVLNYLDPKNELIHHRLYRDHCVQVNGMFIKDLRVIRNRRLKDMAIVDNSLYSFGYQIDNGVPITSWYSDRKDRELRKIVKYLEQFAEANDVRELNAEMFMLSKYQESLTEKGV